MSTSREFTDYVLDQLADVGVIQTSRLFGGMLLKMNNKQIALIVADTLYFKIKEPELQVKFEAMDSEQFVYSENTDTPPTVMKNWWSVPERILRKNKKLTSLAYEVLLQGSA